MKTKIPTCKYCGGPHYSFNCFRKPKKPIKNPTRPFLNHPQGTPDKETHKLPFRQEDNRQRLIKQLDKVVSQYIRMHYADSRGYVRCYTCGKIDHWKNMDNGHFIKRRYLNTRWDVKNLRVQCQYCNRTLNGNYEVYTRKITNELGEQGVQELKQLALSGNKVSTTQIKQMLKEYTSKLHQLVKSRKSC